MKERTKAWLRLTGWLVLLLLVLWIPESGALVFIGLILWYGYKKIRHIPIITIKKKRK